MKLGSKCLANHVQPFTMQQVHQDQTAFVKGKSISEKFIYATDTIQSCHSRKAVDLVSWHALIEVLKAKGFPERWCRWISNLNSSSQSVVLLNGKPGPWIKYRRGLRQGDPLSPFISIIVADVLQRVPLEASSYNLLSHPLDDSLTCPVIQFADDTLIIVKACQESDTSNLSYLHSPK